MSPPLNRRVAHRLTIRVEHVVMAVSVLALLVLVVLPLASMVWGSVSEAGRPTLAHFREALSSRLYVQALRNSLVLGLWTAVLSIAVGVPLAWAVSRTNMPAKRFVHLTAVISYVTPPYLTAIAFVNLFSPNAGLVNRFFRDELGLPADGSSHCPLGSTRSSTTRRSTGWPRRSR